MDEWIDRCMYMYGWIDEGLNEWMGGSKGGRMDERMNGCMV